jgi:Ran GTPase-activating protein (RanGAP) involved in mRNA processing and transport
MNNTSRFELSFSGLQLDNFNFINLMIIMPENRSLLTLDLSRKNLEDSEARQIADMLKVNKKLRRLELEGNFFGPEACKYFAEALKVNKSLKYLDLENNKLTNQGEDDSGIIEIFKALETNKTLISLNLNNNYLTTLCGHAICECLRENQILIHLDVMNNQKFISKKNERVNEDGDSKYVTHGLNLIQLEEIKDKLAENKVLFDQMRKEEWKERKKMNVEDGEVTNVANYFSHLK